MTPTQKQFHDILNDSALQVVLYHLNPATGRPHTHKEVAETLTHLAECAPDLLEQEIRHLQAKINLIRAYLPPEASR